MRSVNSLPQDKPWQSFAGCLQTFGRDYQRPTGEVKHAGKMRLPRRALSCLALTEMKPKNFQRASPFPTTQPLHRIVQHPARRKAAGRKTLGPRRKSVAKRNPSFMMWHVWLDNSPCVPSPSAILMGRLHRTSRHTWGREPQLAFLHSPGLAASHRRPGGKPAQCPHCSRSSEEQI